MPKRTRPSHTSRSEHWLRSAVNDAPDFLNSKVLEAFGWPAAERIVWRSPIREDDYAEYYDEAFLERLQLQDLRTPMRSFWPASGPRWDALAITDCGKVLLVEAKAHIDESVDYGSGASPDPYRRIQESLAAAKKAFRASVEASWESPFYQYANRLAHLYFLRGLNGIDAYLLFLYFADAPDVPKPCTLDQWTGAICLTKTCLGLGAHPYQKQVKDLVVRVPDILSNTTPNTAAQQAGSARPPRAGQRDR